MSAAEFIYTVLLKPPLLRKVANFTLIAILPRTIKVKGATIHLNPADPVVSGALTFRSYENDEIEFFVKWFEPGMTFVDVGANVGLYTGLALHRSSKTQILCIEPDKDSSIFLNQTIQSNRSEHSNVTVFNVAASNSKENIILYKNSQNKGDNRIYANPLCNEQIAIESNTLDDLCRKSGLHEVNFLKIDIQGAEFKALSGAKQILSQSSDCIIMTEFWPYGLKQCDSDPLLYLSLLQNLGFKLYELSGKSLTEIKDLEKIISQCPGRSYKNLIGLKGRFILK